MNSAGGSIDLRVRRTDKFLWEALVSLLAERDFESITVAAICERAMVHRTTFYKHFEDKYGLLFAGIQDELNALFEAFDTVVAKPLELDKPPDIVARLVTVFEHVLKRERFYRLMFTGNGLSRFSTLLSKSLADRFERRLRREGQQDSALIALNAQLHAAAMVTVIAWWLENECPYTPVAMTELLQRHLATGFDLARFKL